MIRITTTLLFFMLLFTSCAERGSNLTPKAVVQKPTQDINAPKAKQTKTKLTTKSTPAIPKPKNKAISTTPQKAKNIPEEKSSFTLSDETQNNISGFLIIIIGLLILI